MLNSIAEKLFGVRGYADSIRRVRGAKSRSGISPYKKRYITLNSDSESETWQDRGGFQVVKGRNKRQRRSTGGTYGQHESSEYGE